MQSAECKPVFDLLTRSCSECGLLPPESRRFKAWHKCAKCQVAQYCCVEHQRRAWKHGGHKVTCGQQLPTANALLEASVCSAMPLLDALRQYGRACPQLAVFCMRNVGEVLSMEGGIGEETRKRELMQLLTERPVYTEVVVQARPLQDACLRMCIYT